MIWILGAGRIPRGAHTVAVNAQPATVAHGARAVLASLLLVAATFSISGSGALAAEPSAEPSVMASSSPAATSAEAMCQSVSDLGLIIGFLRDTSLSEEGVVPLVVGAIAGISEGQQLLGLVDENYRPLVE